MGISLTAGMRANLISLQNTAKLMQQTSLRLNTGKKVNSALDDPVSYFTARGHMSRASDLATLKDGMSEGIQTITAANDGITAIITLIEDAKAKALSAKSAETGSNYDTVNLTLSDVVAGDVVTIGGTAYTATAAGVTAGENEFNINEGTYANQITAMNLAELINSTTEAPDIDATVSGAVLSLSTTAEDLTAETVDVSAAYDSKFVESSVIAATGNEVAELVSQYATLMAQIDQMQQDSGYKGINLLDHTNTLTVNFEGTNKLDVAGFNSSRDGLELSGTATSGWTSDEDIDVDIARMDAAMNTLESKASTLASSTSIVTTRQNFTESMINTLTTGADNLTLADMNEEGANMLMLQTQQALGTTALGLAAQTAQSVLRLF